MDLGFFLAGFVFFVIHVVQRFPAEQPDNCPIHRFSMVAGRTGNKWAGLPVATKKTMRTVK